MINEIQIYEGDMTLEELKTVNHALAAKFAITIDPAAALYYGAALYVPEPATLSLLLFGGLAGLLRRRR